MRNTFVFILEAKFKESRDDFKNKINKGEGSTNITIII